MGSPPVRPAAFVGRTEELAALMDAYEAAAVGHFVPVVVAGEAGIGKTRLVEELTALAQARDIPVHWGRSLEFGGAPALWPWTQVLDGIVSEDGAQRLPALAQDGADRFATFDAVSRVLATHGDRPRIVVLDDLHQADLASLELLRFLTRAAADVPLLVIGTKRTNAMAHDSERDVLLGEIVRTGRRIELRGLERDDVGRLVADLGATAAGPDVVERILARSAGNTLFVDELARAVSRDGADALDSIPSGVRAAVRQRLAGLSERSRRALEAVAVFAHDVDVSSLALVLDRPPREVLDDLEPTVTMGILVAEDAGRFRLSHDLVRDAIHQGLGGSERGDLHRLVASALGGDLSRRATAAEVAEHHRMAGALAEPVEAAEWSSRAAAEARDLHAARDAAEWAEEAARRWHEAGKTERWVEATLDAAIDRADQGNAHAANALADQVIAEARANGSVELFGRAALARLVAWDPSQAVDGVALIKEVLRRPDADRLGELRVTLLVEMASLAGMPGLSGPPADAALARQALAEVEELSRTEGYDLDGELAALRLTIEHGPGTHEQRKGWLVELDRAALDGQDVVDRAVRRYWNTSVAFEAGDLDRVAANLEEWEAVAALTSSAFWRWRAIVARASLASARGRFDEAERIATQSLPLVAGLHPDMAMQVVGGLILGMRYDQGRLDEATLGLSEDDLGMIAILVPVFHGDKQGAARLLEDLVKLEADTSPSELHWLCLMSMIARGAACADDVERCRWVVEQLTPYADQCVMFGRSYVFGGPVTELLALAHRALGDRDAAAAAFEAELEWADRNGATSWGVHARLGLASVLDEDDQRRSDLLERVQDDTAPVGHGAGSRRGRRRARGARSEPGPDGRGPPPRHQDRRGRGQRRRRDLRAGTDPRNVRRDPHRLRRAGALDVEEGARRAQDPHVQSGPVDHREELIERLWPDVDLPTGRSRLSVVLSMVRAALDPEKRWPADHAVLATRDAVALNLDHVDVDVEELLTLIQGGLLAQASAEGRRDLALAVDEVWKGPFLSEDLYADWTTALRGRVDAAQASALRALAQAAVASGSSDEAIGRFAQLIELDPYDEAANRQLIDALVAAGSHGEAQRHHEMFTARMRELGLPDPPPLVPHPAT